MCGEYPVRAIIVANHPISNVVCLVTVDASEAGEGSVEIVVTDQNNRHIATRVEQISTGRYAVTFVAQDAVHHRIDVTFNKDPVPGAPFGVDIMDASKVYFQFFSLFIVHNSLCGVFLPPILHAFCVFMFLFFFLFLTIDQDLEWVLSIFHDLYPWYFVCAIDIL